MAQHQRTARPLLRSARLPCVDGYRHRGRDPLIAAAGVAHHRHHRTRHAGVARGGSIGQHPGKEAVAHDVQLPPAAQRPPQRMTVFATQCQFGRSHIEPARLVDERQFVDRRRQRIVENPSQRQRYARLFLSRRRTRPAVEHDLAVAGQIDEAGVRTRDHRFGPPSARRTMHFDIERLGDPLFERDRHGIGRKIIARTRHRFGRHVAQHLQPAFRPPDLRAERHGDRQPDHPRTGNPDAHRIFEDIGAQQHLDTFGQAAEQLAGTRRTQRHGHRFGAPDRRHDLAPKQIGNGFSLRRRNHLEKKFYAPKDTDKRRQKQLFQALCRNGRSKTRLNR